MPAERLEQVTRLSRLVVRVLGLNPGPFSLQGTNTYLVGAGGTRLLVDAGEGIKGYVPLLVKVMADEGVERISDVLITHYHRDHSEGLKDLRAELGDFRAWKLNPAYAGEHGPSFDLAAFGVRDLADGQSISTEDGSATLRVMATPGHTVDHACFVLDEEKAIFSGDCVLGGSSAVFEDLSSYMRSLNLLLDNLPAATVGGAAASAAGKPQDDTGVVAATTGAIYPGHGPLLVDGRKAVLDYISHRTERERQVQAALRQARATPLLSILGMSPFGIVRQIYPQLGWKLRLAAAFQVDKHLEKLEADGVAKARTWAWFPFKFMGMRLDRIFLRRWHHAA